MAHYNSHKPEHLAKNIVDLQEKHAKAKSEVGNAEAALENARQRLKTVEDEMATVLSVFVKGFPPAVREALIKSALDARTEAEKQEAWEQEEAEAAAEAAGER